MTLSARSFGNPNVSASRCQLAPMRPHGAMPQTASRVVGAFSGRRSHCRAGAGATGSRLLITLRRISRHPPTVLTFKPSVENSTTPGAARKALAGSGLLRSHCCTPLPSSSHTRRTTSLLTDRRDSSFRWPDASSNEVRLPASTIIRRAWGVTRCVPLTPAQASQGTCLARQCRQA